MSPDAPTVISTFAGCGGSSLGYQMAGFRELLAVEWDDNAVATFRLNFPDVPVYHGDIAKLSVEECLRLTGIEPGQLDVLDGSPPCQGFSTAGRRKMGDDRNQLFREYCRLLRGLQPRVFVMENVSGMIKGKMKLLTAEVFRELEGCGYRVKAQLMNAMYFGVPQSRERMIFVGVRKDLTVRPSHPKPQTRLVAVKEALRNLKIPVEELDYARKAIENRKNSIGRVLLATGPGMQLSDIEPRGFFWNWVRLHPDRPSPTITKDDANICHSTEHRIITPVECRRLASFPDDFVFLGDCSERRARIGNSVPPLFMKAIACHIRSAILDAVQAGEGGSRPTSALGIGV